MPFPSEHHFKSLSAHGFHRVVYRQWGDPENARVVVCVHGLTRNGRDFDTLAAAISDRYRVICPDMPGRGDSEWLRDPHDYGFPAYLTTLTALLAHAHADRVAWLDQPLAHHVAVSRKGDHDRVGEHALDAGGDGGAAPVQALQRVEVAEPHHLRVAAVPHDDDGAIGDAELLEHLEHLPPGDRMAAPGA